MMYSNPILRMPFTTKPARFALPLEGRLFASNHPTPQFNKRGQVNRYYSTLDLRQRLEVGSRLWKHFERNRLCGTIGR